VRESPEAPGYPLKIIPHVDGTPRICEIARYQCGEVVVHGAWEGPAACWSYPTMRSRRSLRCPVLEVLSASHILSDLTLNLGSVVPDYLASGRKKP
jgi:acetoacetate decarboxylase